MDWVNMKCDGSIETSEGTIPNKLHRAADVYADHKVAQALTAGEPVSAFGLFDYSTVAKLRNPLKKLGIKLTIKGRKEDDQSTITLEKISTK